MKDYAEIVKDGRITAVVMNTFPFHRNRKSSLRGTICVP